MENSSSVQGSEPENGGTCYKNGSNSCCEDEEETSDEIFLGSLTDDINFEEHSSNKKDIGSCEGEATKKPKPHPFSRSTSWKTALEKAKYMPDPWEKFHIDESCPMENAVRHRYNAVDKTWLQDDVKVKIENVPFDHGAMRMCFRMKKLSNFSKRTHWKGTTNYVAKHYIEEVPRKVYFDDVRLQMDAKLWGEEYNRRDPPKKVDIFQVYVIEMKEREGLPLFHVEHFIEGQYTKYNSNSGFVLRDETLRSTPQAFSHFTFERSGHQLIVVDIQGVGDLYTDPQIHTGDGFDYGDGNMGHRGMALFFSSHKCNRICTGLRLSEFELSPKEHERIETSFQNLKDSSTVLRGEFDEFVLPLRKKSSFDMTDYIAHSPPPTSVEPESLRGRKISCIPNMSEYLTKSPPYSRSSSVTSSSHSRCDSESSGGEADLSDVLNEEEEQEIVGEAFYAKAGFVHKASTVFAEVELIAKVQAEKLLREKSESILGQVHLELAKYNEIGRFTENEPDMESALYHLELAAACGVAAAVINMAEILLQLPHEILNSVTVQETEESTNRGVEFMLQAAEIGERAAMVYMAKAFETGEGLGTKRSRSWKEAVHWYEQAILKETEDEVGENPLLLDSNYQLYARQAALYRSGGFGLDKDPQVAGDSYSTAGDEAMAAMKGRLATKYYELAEEAWAEVEE